MSRQVNLLVREQGTPELSALRSLIGLGVALTMILAYSGYGWISSRKSIELEDRANAALATDRAKLKDLEQKLGARPKLADIVAQIDALKAQAAESEQIINLLHTGGGGASRDGYSGHLKALARISEDGVWLTSADIGNAGRAMRVEGHSLRADSVMRYAQRLNEQFSVYGAQFTALELTPDSGTDTASGAAGSSVAFKLF
jgi:Tfp pilus assembly protein PilN